jgi:hypothetical protein
LRQADGAPASTLDTLRVQLGQPVRCGTRAGVPVSALRICASARWAVAAAGTPDECDRAVRQAMSAFDKLALLARRLHRNDLGLAARG